MDHDELPCHSARISAWLCDYHATLRTRAVRAPLLPGAVADALPERAPEAPETFDRIFEDFERLIPGALTHWQHPRFFAYFPANAAPASMLAEQLANGIAAQCMLWQTSPAATELEQVMVRWLRDALGLAGHFCGTLHDSATTATLSAVLGMRERALDWAGNAQGLSGMPPLRLYASAEAHSSVAKAARIAGFGQAGLVRVAVRADHGMDPQALRRAIAADRAAARLPAGVVLCCGATSIGACDPLAACIEVAREADLPVHVDAAWAGSAMICPEFRPLWNGVDGADSIVFNPHKWLGAQFDCAVQFLADPRDQIRTLGLRPDYLHGPTGDEIVDFNEWTVPLGRRFRALKLWFVLRAEGLEGLRGMIRNHVAWARELAAEIARIPQIEIVTAPVLSLFTFRLRAGCTATEALLTRINDDGRIYLTQTRHQGRVVIRVQVGSLSTTREDVGTVADVVRALL